MSQSREWNPEALELHFLKWLDSTNERRISAVSSHFIEYVKNRHPEYHNRLFVNSIAETVSSLLRQGLLYVDFIGISQASGWGLRLTEAGKVAVKDGEYSPYNSEEYLRRFQVDVPTVTPTILQYAREALLSFKSGCYLATAVMTGVASEVAFTELCGSLGNWLGKELGGKNEEEFRRKLTSKRQYNDKFAVFRTTVDMNKEVIGKSVLENIEIPLNSILEIFRTYRNDAGHATGEPVGKEDADLILHLFPKYMQRLYRLKGDLS